MLNLINYVSIQGGGAMVFYFTLYSFCGWILENSYSFLLKEGFFKANFLKGPFKPMYGFAPVFLLFFITERTPWHIVLFLCLFIPTLVEYLTGVMLKKVFNRPYWDYSNIPFQLHGHICLPFSICWVVLSFGCLQWIHPAVSSLYDKMEPYWSWMYPAVIFYFTTELFLAIRKNVFFPQKEPTNPIS
jgi:uncharacterized membrane protein